MVMMVSVIMVIMESIDIGSGYGKALTEKQK